jgi:hypothetical protein
VELSVVPCVEKSDNENRIFYCNTSLHVTLFVVLNKPGLWSLSWKEFWVESESVKMFRLRLRPRCKILNRY